MIGYCYKNRTRCSKNNFLKLVHKTTEATKEFIGNKIADKLWKQNLCLIWIQEVLNSCFTREKTRNIKLIKKSIIK